MLFGGFLCAVAFKSNYFVIRFQIFFYSVNKLSTADRRKKIIKKKQHEVLIYLENPLSDVVWQQRMCPEK